MKELEDLMENNTWKIVCTEEVSPEFSILNGRFFVEIKDKRTNKEHWKARLIVQGCTDAMNQSLVHNTFFARQPSTKIVVRLAFIFRFNLYSSDVT